MFIESKIGECLPRIVQSLTVASALGLALTPSSIEAPSPSNFQKMVDGMAPHFLGEKAEMILIPPQNSRNFGWQEVNPYLGIRNEDPTYLQFIEELQIGAVKLAGNWSDVGADGRLENKHIEQMLEEASRRKLDILYTFAPNLLVDNNEIARRIRPVLSNYDVFLELGNEPDDSGTPFWQDRDLFTFAEFIKRGSGEALKINPRTRIVVGALIDEKNTGELLEHLQTLEVDISKFWFAVHAYHSTEEVERRVRWVQSVTDRPTLITEMGVNSWGSTDPNALELEAMLSLGVELTNNPVFIHQLKRHKANEEEVYGLVEPSTRKTFPLYDTVQNWSKQFIGSLKSS